MFRRGGGDFNRARLSNRQGGGGGTSGGRFDCQGGNYQISNPSSAVDCLSGGI